MFGFFENKPKNEDAAESKEDPSPELLSPLDEQTRLKAEIAELNTVVQKNEAISRFGEKHGFNRAQTYAFIESRILENEKKIRVLEAQSKITELTAEIRDLNEAVQKNDIERIRQKYNLATTSEAKAFIEERVVHNENQIHKLEETLGSTRTPNTQDSEPAETAPVPPERVSTPTATNEPAWNPYETSQESPIGGEPSDPPDTDDEIPETATDDAVETPIIETPETVGNLPLGEHPAEAGDVPEVPLTPELPVSETETPVEPRVNELGGVNPDRVRIETNVSQREETIHHPPVIHETIETVAVPGRFRAFLDRARLAENWRKATVWGMIGAFAGTLGANLGIENQYGKSNESLTNATNVKKALETTNMEVFAQNVQKEVCNYLLKDTNFMHRFIMKDANGNESVNPGAIVMPFSVSLHEKCTAMVDVQLLMPYHFARTYMEIIAKYPARRAELINKLAQFILEQVQNKTVIRGIAGATDTTFVWNKEKNILVGGKPVIDLGKLDISSLTFEGGASDEAMRSVMNTGAESIEGFNPENLRLAGKRLEDFKPILKDALVKAGVDPQIIAQAKEFKLEHILVASEAAELAQIAHTVLGGTITGTDKQLAFKLLQEINAGNPVVMQKIQSDPAMQETIHKYVTSKRGVTVSFDAKTEYSKTEVYSVFVPLPLLLLLLGAVRLERTPTRYTQVPRTHVEETPDTHVVTEVVEQQAVARRLFSETTPSNLPVERSFNDVYESIDLGENAEDTHTLLEHMLIEEVLPTLDEETKEPMIDYEAVVNKFREYLSADARKTEVKKGHYDTDEEMMRHMTEEIVDMWERHDAATYPMQGIDVKTVLNYRHSENVTYWAKTLAYLFVKLAKETTTTEQFRNQLNLEIQKVIENRNTAGGSNRNMFVRSVLPRTA